MQCPIIIVSITMVVKPLTITEIPLPNKLRLVIMHGNHMHMQFFFLIVSCNCKLSEKG